MIKAIKSFASKHPTATYVIVGVIGGVVTLSFSFVAKLLSPAANAVTAVKNKVAPGA